MVKTFRGILEDGGQDRIRLSTMKGKVGYQVRKFQVMSNEPFAKSGEHVGKIYKTFQSTIDALVDFSDTDLLGTALWRASASETYPLSVDVIFDNQIINQDIYITHSDINTDDTLLSYYIELETIALDDKGAEYTTIRDLRTRGF
jgi:hypothetical protein